MSNSESVKAEFTGARIVTGGTNSRVSTSWFERTRLRGFITFCLLVATLLYLGKGFYFLVLSPKSPVDLRLRWVEQRYIQSFQNPYDLTYVHLGVGAKPWLPNRNTSIIETLEVPDSGGYPPWAFFSGFLFLWPSWPVARSYFAALSLLALIIVMAWSYQLGQRTRKSDGLFFLLAATALSAHCTNLYVGNYGTIVTGLLVAALWLEDRGHSILSGLALGVALLKPTIAGPFVLCYLVQRRFTAVLLTVAYLAVGSSVIWIITATNPVEMLGQMLAASQEFLQDSQGFVTLLFRMGVPTNRITPVLAVVILIPGIALLIRFRNQSFLELFAIASVIARLWSYHKVYDNMMLVFLLMALASAAFGPVPSRLSVWAFMLVSLSLWAPASLTNYPQFLTFQFLSWLFGLTVLLTRQGWVIRTQGVNTIAHETA